MAQTLDTARTRGRAKKREKPLGVAVALGLAAALAVAILIVVVQLLIPHTVLNNFYTLVHYNASATLPLDPLYQKWYETLSEEDVFGTAFSLLCGGLVVGWFAPSYVSRPRVLVAGAALGFGLPLVCLAFLWIGGVVEQNTLNAHEGGRQVGLAAPPVLILTQAALVIVWAAICVFGTWAGLWLRRRSRAVEGAAAAQ